MKIYIRKGNNAPKETIQTKDTPLGKGGQGAIYNIVTAAYSDYCLKKYRDAALASAAYDRILFMIDNQPNGIIGNDNFRICWPIALAYDDADNFIGYIMPLAFPKSRDLLILAVYSAKPISQQGKYKKYPEWFDKYEFTSSDGIRNRMKMLCNWAIAIHCLHATGKYVIVDLKPENIMATATGKISVVDTDSFQISQNGRILFPGMAFTPSYFPPEGKQISISKQPFPATCDCFSAAVCFYKILVGVHPFGGTVLKSPYDKCETEEECISSGLFAFGEKKQYISFNPAFNLHKNFENLPGSVQRLFIRAFGSNVYDRPTMEEWGKTLYSEISSGTVVPASDVRPNIIDSSCVEILKAEYADTDYDDNIIRNYGSKLFNDISYLTPRITYRVLKESGTPEVWYKITSPSGVLLRSQNSRPGFTWRTQIDASSKGTYTVVFNGYGGQSKATFKEAGRWKVDYYIGNTCLYKSFVDVAIPGIRPPIRPTSSRGNSSGGSSGSGTGKWWKWVAGIASVLVLAVSLILYFRSKDTGTLADCYVFADRVYLRGAPSAQSDNLGTLDYGTALDLQSREGNWLKVTAGGKSGYVHKDYVMDAKDFVDLNCVWADEQTLNAISDARYRMAIMNLIVRSELVTGPDGWQISAQDPAIKPNTIDISDDWFAFIISSKKERKAVLAIYVFEADGTPNNDYITKIGYADRIQSVRKIAPGKYDVKLKSSGK